ncbi:Atp-binding protein, partial [Globisporangium splendens]
MSSSSSSDASSLLTQCLASIVTYDIDYAMCIMNSGMFSLDTTEGTGALASSSWLSSSALAVLIQQLVGSSTLSSANNAGTCRLMCTAPTMTATHSCCEAASKVQKCETTSESLKYCKSVIDDSFALKNQCGLSSENIGLIVACAIIVFAFAVLMVLSRVYAKKQFMASSALESRFAIATMSRWKAILAAWRQVTNLVWKNVIIRRRRPISFIIEQFLPVVLVTGLVFIANLDTLFGDGSSSSSGYDDTEASNTTTTILCTDLDELDEQAIGAPSNNMTTFFSTGQTVIGLFLLISYIKFVSTTTTTMVIEKETRVREIMKIMGLSDLSLLFSWFVTNAVLATPLAFVIAAELKYGKVFPGAEYATLVFLFWALSLAILSFSYFITPFFNKSRTASIASVLLWLILFFPFYFVQPKSNARKYAAALSPPAAFALGIDDLLRRAQLGTGFAYSIAIIESPVTVPTAFEMSWFLMMDSFLLFALGWYLEQVLPQQYGVPRPWNFMFKREFWMKVESGGEDDPVILSSPRDDLSSPRTTSPYSSGPSTMLQHQGSSDGSVIFMKEQSSLEKSVEPVNSTLAIQEEKGTCLQIQGLRKVFPGDDGDEKIAVNQLNLTMYSGHITALLGHNGAGKTTTISMLTGLITPSSGDAKLYGRSLKHNFNELRQIMGICPQHDVLLNELTVVEHLQLFGTMKHIPPSQLDEEVERMIKEVGLTEKRKTRSKDLSGGQKRKLSVAIAFVGDSKLVFLDEPTSGMDPYSRRFTWNLLQRNREDRVIVLTTHFMDEADILGDRIAIMADGELCCAGSSLFLKNRYGAGYNLTLIKGAHCDVEAVSHFLRQFVPEAKCLSNFGSEVVFQLPSASSGMFSSMLQAMDQHMHQIGVVQYGISVTTLEEVFLRIAQDREEGAVEGLNDVDCVGQRRKTSATSMNSRPTRDHISSTATYEPSFWTQYSALVTKRFRITKRDRKSLVNAIIVPLIFLIILVLLPEIDVANFLPDDYASGIASQARQNNCTSANFTMVSYSTSDQTYCLSNRFDYCDMGIIDCDATTCCNQYNAVSPYYACNLCSRSASQPNRPKTPCYNSQCLDRDGAKLQVTLNGFLVSVIVMLAFAFIPAAVVAFIVREKNPIQNAKSLQLICGANMSAYWFSSWTHDILLILISVVAAVIIVPFSNRTLSSSTEVMGVAALVGSHAITVIPLAYLFSFRFEKHAVAQTSLLVFALSTGGLLSIFSFLCRIINFELAPSNPDSITLSELDRNYLRWIFMLFPGYSLNNGIYEIASRKLSRSALFGTSGTGRPSSFFGLWEGLGKDPNCVSCWMRNVSGCCDRDVFDIDVAGAPFVYMLIEAVLFTILVFAIENRSVIWNPEQRRTQQLKPEDDDVARERRKIESSRSSSNDSIFIRNLRQQYGKGGKVALNDLCLSIPKGECFGYLGINGAGKSTTMKVLTGQIAPTNGFVSLGGYDLSRSRDKARTVIGYCPQFDSLHDLLTVKEQLELYARLKGIPDALVPLAVDEKIKEVGLTEYQDKLTRGLSGGNKRKVSTAIALIGAPKIIFLDEPSTGVDPSSRRKMWDVIAAVCAEKESCVVLTTHSMEECEALCTRVGILVSGKLKCLGSVEHLKQKFGRGYTVEVTLREPDAIAVGKLCDEVERILGNSTSSISRDNVMNVCSTLGIAKRGQMILTGDGNGWILGSYLDSSGSIPVEIFASWWLSETLSEALQAFFSARFSGSELVEHQGDHFRFQVPKHTLRPHVIFGLLEENKPQLHINEYGVSETSLEHIFNNMAAQQDEERLVANGMYDENYRNAQAEGARETMELRPSSMQSIRSYHRSNSQRASFTA